MNFVYNCLVITYLDFLNVIDVRFPLPIGWALKDNQILGIRGSGIRIKKNVKAMLERFFLLGNQ